MCSLESQSKSFKSFEADNFFAEIIPEQNISNQPIYNSMVDESEYG